MNYSSLYDGLKRNEKSSLCFNIQFIIRRLLLNIVLLNCQFNTMFQISFSISLSLITIIYLLKYKPLESKYENILMIINECIIMISEYILASLALISQSGIVIRDNMQLGDPIFEFNLGNILILLIILQVLINICWVLVKMIYDGYRKYSSWKKEKIYNENVQI
jgi:hypothetical protein